MRSLVHLSLTLLCLAAPAAAEEIVGTARVSDGDTIRVGGTKVRIHGIDTPEIDQTCRTEHGHDFDCGRAAADWARDAWEGRWMRCERLDTDRYGRAVATCWLGEADIAEAIVREGYAWAYVEYSSKYLDAQEAAQADAAGLWAVTQDAPWEHRAELREIRRTAARAQVPPDPGCAIKGNVSGNGRIYHVPGGRDYDATVISTDRGERWFCSAAEAEREGWRAARR